MDATTVYTVAKALPRKEYEKLYTLFRKDFEKQSSCKILKLKSAMITDEEAINYLLKNVFHSKK